jgi:adenylate cyclase
MHAHVRVGLREEVVTVEETRSGRIDDTWTVSVCFVDLVGFTELGDRLDAEEAHALARGLARIAAGVATPPVRLVKTMGDGAMLVSTEPRPLIDAALEMAAKVAEDDRLPALRAGISHGEAFTRGGDWYGTSVNLASRIVDVAEPGTVLAARSVRDAAPEGYTWSAWGRERLRGLTDEVELFRVAPEPPARRKVPPPSARE